MEEFGLWHCWGFIEAQFALEAGFISPFDDTSQILRFRLEKVTGQLQ